MNELIAAEHQHCVGCIQGERCRDGGSCPVQRCPNQCGAWAHACKMEDHVSEVCELAEMACPNAMYGCPSTLQRRNLSLHLPSCPANVVLCRCLTMRPAEPDQAHGVTVAHGPFERSSICDQFVRRDTFADHMLEHSETQSALDGWFEGRCPLASHGCPFVFRRWHPATPGITVRFNAALDALVSTSETEHAEANACHILTLPIEVQVRILSLLDGLSLASLACTCVAMRRACSMLLRSKGYVTRQWRSVGGGKWELKETRHWSMNRSMEPVRKWRINEDGLAAVQRHLLNCSFNRREPMSNEPQLVIHT